MSGDVGDFLSELNFPRFFASYAQMERRVMDPLKSMKNVLLSAPETIMAKIDEMTNTTGNKAPGPPHASSSSATAGNSGTSSNSPYGRERIWENRSSPEYGKFVWTDPWTLDVRDHLSVYS
jgi:hypothetical protein